MNITDKIFRFNRNPTITENFRSQLDQLTHSGVYSDQAHDLLEKILGQLTQYRKNHNIRKVFVGMSGGIDSALTAALFKRAGYYVTGVIMPIHQKTDETQRGLEACEVLEIDPVILDLTAAYDGLIEEMQHHDELIKLNNIRDAKRRGNIRARLRMISLYNQASLHGGFVASTDNFSELAAGFWTLHGDVGDVAPIQSLTKSWEVPLLSELVGVPQSIIDAVPTDGLGISPSDEHQFGFSYLEFDIVLMSLLHGIEFSSINRTSRDTEIVDAVQQRIRDTAFKRSNPHNLDHPIHTGRLSLLENLDLKLRS
jgi:NAD+ synthase